MCRDLKLYFLVFHFPLSAFYAATSSIKGDERSMMLTYGKVIERSNDNSWLTPGIRISCKCKRCLCLLTKDSDYIILKNYYNQYCKTLTSVIKEAKKYMYNNRIINSTNKMKTTWTIIKAETNRLKGPITTTINNNQNSPEAFNKYFLL
jgi:hypothetical protein